MKATSWIETCPRCHSVREVIVDYEMSTTRDGRLFYCFENKQGERYIGTREDVELLIQLLQLRLTWMKEDEAPAAEAAIARAEGREVYSGSVD